MQASGLRCERCPATYPFTLDFQPCTVCGDPLSIVYDAPITASSLEAMMSHARFNGLDRFRAMLPVPQDAAMVSLGEGGTMPVQNARLNADLNLPNLRIKNESGNPSWSFKDRLNAVNATLAKANGFSGIVASSTGNHGASAAAYAAAAGLDSIVLFPFGTPQIYLDQVAAYGGRAVAMNWNDRGAALARLVRAFGWFPSKSSLPAPVSNPFGLEGYKTIAYEIVADLGVSQLPEFLFVPIGSGDDFTGIARGFIDLRNAGIIGEIPVLVACEAAGASPLSDAHKLGLDRIVAVKNPRTVAVSISEGIVSNLALRALHEVCGETCTVSEAEIVAAGAAYARCGFVAEMSSCAALAAASRFKKTGRMRADARAVVMLTGTGLRWPNQIPRNREFPGTVGRQSAVDSLWIDLQSQAQGCDAA